MASNLFSQANYNAMCECLSSLLKNAVEACRPGDRIDVIAEVLEAGDPDGAMWSGLASKFESRFGIRDAVCRRRISIKFGIYTTVDAILGEV